MQFPPLEDAIFIDIETDLDMSNVWLIGLKLEDKETQYLAWNYREEIDILEDFGYYLSKHPNKPLICYSTTNFDFRVLKAAAKSHNLDWVLEQMNQRALIDLGTLLRRHFTPFGKRYSLKLLRFLIGYSYSDLSIDGEEVAIRYYQHVKAKGRIPKDFAKMVLQYNLDDIRILHYMIELFKHNIEFTNNYSKPITLKKIKGILETEIYSKNINDDFIRVSVNNNQVEEIMQRLMCYGLPLPQVSRGVNVSALYWKSSFSFEQAKNLFDNMNY